MPTDSAKKRCALVVHMAVDQLLTEIRIVLGGDNDLLWKNVQWIEQEVLQSHGAVKMFIHIRIQFLASCFADEFQKEVVAQVGVFVLFPFAQSGSKDDVHDAVPIAVAYIEAIGYLNTVARCFLCRKEFGGKNTVFHGLQIERYPWFQPGLMCQDLPKLKLLLIAAFTDRVDIAQFLIEVELSFVHQIHQGQRGGGHLGYGGQIVEVCFLHRPFLIVGMETIGLFEHDLAPAGNEDLRTGKHLLRYGRIHGCFDALEYFCAHSHLLGKPWSQYNASRGFQPVTRWVTP